MKKYLKPLDINIVKQIYEQTNSLKETAKIIGCGRSKLQTFCAKNNIKHSYVYNHNSFSTKTNETSYWAGLIASDGCIYKNFLKVVLHKDDALHLNKLYEFLQSKTKTEPLIRGKYAFLELKSKQMRLDLFNNFNITPKKSLTLQPPKLKNEEQERNFIRGYSDGDGCLSWKNKENCAGFNIIGASYNMIDWIKETIFKNTNINVNIYKQKKYFRICYNGRLSIKILKWLYSNSKENFYLDRKYNKFVEIVKRQEEKEERIRQRQEKLNKEIELMKKLYKCGLTYKQIAEYMNIKKSKVFYHMSKELVILYKNI